MTLVFALDSHLGPSRNRLYGMYACLLKEHGKYGRLSKVGLFSLCDHTNWCYCSHV